MYVHVTRIFPCGTSLKAPMYSCMIQFKNRILSGLSREGSTIHEILETYVWPCHFFAFFSLPPTLWIYGGASKGRTANQAGRQMQYLALWMTPLGRRHRSKACGHLLVVTWIREHQGGRSVPAALAVWKGFPEAESRFPEDLLLAQLHTYSPCSGSFAVQLLSTVELNCSRMWKSKPFSQKRAHVWLWWGHLFHLWQWVS